MSYNFLDLFGDLEIGQPYMKAAFLRHPHETVEYVALDFVKSMANMYYSE